MIEPTQSTWTVEHLRSVERLAMEDAARMEYLNRRLAEHKGATGDEPAFCGCGIELHASNMTGKCERCYRREWMRANRLPRTRAQMDRHNERRRERRAMVRGTP